MKPQKNLTLWFAGLLIGALALNAEIRVTTQQTPFEGKRAKTLTDHQGNVHLIFNKQGNIFYSRLNDGEGSFSEPLQVNSIDRTAAVGEIAVSADGRVHIFYHGNIFYIRDQIKSENRKVRATDIKYAFYSRLNDAGDGFEEQRDMARGVWGFDGGCAAAADSNGNVYLFFGGTVKQGKEQDRQVFLLHSNDNGTTFSDPRPIDIGLGVCACCHLKAQTNDNGEVMLAYRVADGGVERDSYVLTSKDHGKSFQKAPLDKWQLRACPGSVYSFANSGPSTFVSWRSKDEIYLNVDGSNAFFSPANKELKRRAAVLGSNERGEVLVAWGEGENFNKPHHLKWQLYDKSGAPIGDVGSHENAFGRWGNAAIYADAHGDFVVLY